MATKKGKFLSGIIGLLKLSKRNEQQIVSTKPGKGKVNQTEATKKASNTFGMASALSNNIKKVYDEYLDGTKDSQLTTRLGTRILDSIRPCRNNETGRYRFERHSFKYLEGLDFNIESPLMRTLGFLTEVTYKDGLLNVKSMGENDLLKIKYPNKAKICDLIVSVALFKLSEGQYNFHPITQMLELTLDNTETGNLDMNFEVPNGCLCVASIFLMSYHIYLGRYVRLNSRDFSPAGICGAYVTPGTFEGEETGHWITHDPMKFDQEKIVK